jgi:hypothetical protein
VQGDGYECWNCTLLVTGMGVILDTVGKDAPHIQTNGPGVGVLPPTDRSADFAKVNWIFDNFGVDWNELQSKRAR